MKLRLRERLERARSTAGAAGETSAPACAAALDVLERAQRLDDPRAVRRRSCRSGRSSAACCPASGWPTRRRPTRSSWTPGRSGWASASRAATTSCRGARPRHPARGRRLGRAHVAARPRAQADRPARPRAARGGGRVRPAAGARELAGEGRARRGARGEVREGDTLGGAAREARRVRRGGALPLRRRTSSRGCCGSRRSRELRLQAALAVARGARRGTGDRRLDQGGAPALGGGAGRRPPRPAGARARRGGRASTSARRPSAASSTSSTCW